MAAIGTIGTSQLQTDANIQFTGSKIAEAQSFDLDALRLKNQNGTKQGEKYFNRTDEQGKKVSPLIAIILEGTELLTKIVGSIAFLVIIVGGIWMIVSLGDEKQITHGKTLFMFALVGLLFTFGAYLFVVILQNLFIEK